MDLISIIVPVYNMEKYIKKCLDSLVNQTYKNIEIIVVNDGSTDKSLEIINKYKSKVTIINKCNGGLSSARNEGLKKSKGKYISFIDSDDYVSLDMIEILYNNIIKTKSDISICNFVTVIDNAIFDSTNNYKIYSKEQIIDLLLLNKVTSHTWNKLYKKELFNKIIFPVNRTYEDIATTYKLFDLSKKVVVTNAKLYAYIQRKDSICGNLNSKKLNDYINSLIERYKYLSNNKIINYNMLYNVIVITYMISKSKKYELFDNKLYKKFYNDYFKLNYVFKLPFKYFISGLLILISPKLFYIIINKDIKKIIPKSLYRVICKTYDELFYLFNKNKINKNNYKIRSNIETIELIKNGYSLTRFGDGEFKWMLGIKQVSFQDDDINLTKRLKEVINSREDKLLIGIPSALNSFNNLKHKAKVFWTVFLNKNMHLIENSLDKKFKYSDTNITRPYIDYKDTSIEKFNLFKSIWDSKDVVIVEGIYTRFGVGNDLLDNAKSVKRILCPATNAFNKYDEILSSIINYKDYLILICLGPTATVLVYDLYKLGVQAIDIGHLDIEYEWFKDKAKYKKAVIGKYVNEAKNNNNLQLTDKKYNKEIIKKIQ